jgi:hypothetical protein
MKFVSFAKSRRTYIIAPLPHPMACRGVEVEAVDLPELGDLFERLAAERKLSFEDVEDDSLE